MSNVRVIWDVEINVSSHEPLIGSVLDFPEIPTNTGKNLFHLIIYVNHGTNVRFIKHVTLKTLSVRITYDIGEGLR